MVFELPRYCEITLIFIIILKLILLIAAYDENTKSLYKTLEHNLEILSKLNRNG